MAIVTTDNKYYAEIANAIRTVNGSTDKYLPAQMAAAILALMGGSGLPDGYIELNYIQCSGTQYIDTGFKPNQNTTLEMKCQASGASAIAAVDTSWTKVGFGILPSFGYYGNSLPSATFTSTTPIVIKQDKNTFYKNGSVVATATASTFQCAYNLVLFGLNRAGKVSEFTTSCQLYYCQIYDNGTLIRDYVPCINPDGAYGLYDLVNAQFYANAGSGSFTGA